VKAAAETVGFFQLVNHGVPDELLSEMLASVRRFNEAPPEAKLPYYTRDARRKLRFNSNFDLFQSPAANWRDTLFCEAAPEPPRAEELPPAVRHVMLEYGGAAREVAARVLALLSEALGLSPGHLAGMGCAEGLSLVCNYYPPCPEPDLTLGCSAHSDPSFLTVLLQDAHAQGGLQALLASGWVDVPPVPGALLVNVGDLLQLVSNGRFRSVEHRVVANRSRDTARVSVACFFNADIARSTRLYGPIEKLITSGDGPGRALYRSVTVPEFLAHYDKKGLDGRPALHHFQLLQ
jgi:isopenicillin N synthase-like dioxygenase